MKLAAVETVVNALNDANVRYLVAGGLAVNAHGYLRLTMDIDLVVALEPDNIASAFAALADIGYTPSIPVTAEELADADTRQRWTQEKNMQVLNFFSDRYPEASVDVFVNAPFDFAREWQRAASGEIKPGVRTWFVCLPTLIDMKQAVGRPRDLDDAQHLRWILEDQQHDQ